MATVVAQRVKTRRNRRPRVTTFAIPRRSGRQAPTSGLVRSIDWHPDLGAELTRPGDLGIWAPLIDPQQGGTGERGTQIFGHVLPERHRSPDRCQPAAVSRRAYCQWMVELRLMRVDDVGLLARWDDDADVAAALGGRGADWYDWPAELVRDVPWRELLIAEADGRPIGFVQLIDAGEEESHYWGDVEPRTWALDIWIGSPGDRGRGLGAQAMRAAIARGLHATRRRCGGDRPEGHQSAGHRVLPAARLRARRLARVRR